MDSRQGFVLMRFPTFTCTCISVINKLMMMMMMMILLLRLLLLPDLYQVPKAQVQVPEVQVRVQVLVPRPPPITPDQVQPKYWSTDSGW